MAVESWKKQNENKANIRDQKKELLILREGEGGRGWKQKEASTLRLAFFLIGLDWIGGEKGGSWGKKEKEVGKGNENKECQQCTHHRDP